MAILEFEALATRDDLGIPLMPMAAFWLYRLP